MIRHIPNSLTLGNLLCGCLGIMMVFNDNLVGATHLILLAAVLDFLDGFAAKALNAASAIGKDLDSLADMVTFGVLPSFILYILIEKGFAGGEYSDFKFAALSVALFSALRLAKFNNDPRQGDRFIGLPTPANTLLIASLPHLDASGFLGTYLAGNSWSLVALSFVLSYLLIAELPLLALKFKGMQWNGNQRRYILIASSVILLVALKWNAVPLILLVYLLISFSEKSNSYD